METEPLDEQRACSIPDIEYSDRIHEQLHGLNSAHSGVYFFGVDIYLTISLTRYGGGPLAVAVPRAV